MLAALATVAVALALWALLGVIFADDLRELDQMQDWNIPEVTAEQKGRHDICDLFPMPADLGYHWPTPQYDGMEARECDLLPGGRCYYDGSGLNAEPVYERLLREGDEGVWAALESYYHELAATPPPPEFAFYQALEATK